MGDVIVEFDNAVLKFSPEKVVLDGFLRFKERKIITSSKRCRKNDFY